MATIRNFTLHHHIARPISLHYYKPIALVLQHLSLIWSVLFIGILGWLMYLAYTTLKGAPLSILLIVTLPLKVAIILFGFFIYYRTTFKRELSRLRERFKIKFEHSFKHK
ncbi:MAG: hypothetical protein QW063_00535 [Candidatus Nanoarchaeia archaeon]